MRNNQLKLPYRPLIDVRTGGEESSICFDMWQRLINQMTALTNQIVELQSHVKTNLRLLPTSTDVYWLIIKKFQIRLPFKKSSLV